MADADIEIAVDAASEEAIQDIEDTEDALEDAGEGMDDTADGMSELRRQMQGAGAAIATSMALMAGGILASIPVVGEAFSGLQAVFDAVMFQLDDLLRSLGVGGLGGVLFSLSEWIFNLEGPLGWLVGALGGLAAVAAAGFAAFAAYAGPITALISLKGALAAAAKAVVAGIVSLVSILGAPVVAIGVLVAAIGLLAWYFRDEIVSAAQTAIDGVLNFASWVANDLPEMIADGLRSVTDWFTDLATDAAQWGVDLVTGFADSVVDTAYRVTNAVGDIAETITETITGLASDASGWGRDLIDNLVESILDGVERVREAAEDVAGTISEYLPSSPAETGPLSDLDDVGPGFVETVAGGIEANVGRASDAAESTAGAMAGGGSGGGFSADRGSDRPVVKMDGRRLTKEDGRYRRDGTASRGRHG